MGRNYNLNTFLRQTPNHTLKEFFKNRNLLNEIDFEKLKKAQAEPIFEAIMALKETERDKIEKEFRVIHELSNRWGTKALIELLKNTQQVEENDNPFEEMQNSYERAFWVYTNHLEIYRIARNYTYMDRFKSWKRHGIDEQVTLDASDEAIKKLILELNQYHRRFGCGDRYKAEKYIRQNPLRHCYFTYMQGYVDTHEELDENNQTQLLTTRPLLENVFVYYPDTKLFETSATGNYKEVNQIKTIFCKTVLGLPQLPPNNKMQFDLDPMWEKDFELPFDSEDDIEAVILKAVKLKLKDDNGTRITIEGGRNCENGEVQEVMKKIQKDQPTEKCPEIIKATFQIKLTEKNRYDKESFQFYIATPDTSSLKEDRIDYVARKYLKEWKLIGK